ncbi:MAG: type II secretion system F family protein, partial [Caldilineaceae bacterium]|nr:type II secretion system F family protein [Caldilineaceae bacterium]
VADPAQLPSLARAVFALSDAVVAHGLLYALIALAFVGLTGAGLANPAIRLRIQTMLYRVPIIGRYLIDARLALLFRTLATTLNAGVSLVKSIEMAVESAPQSPLRQALSRILGAIRAGDGLSQALGREATVFPRDVVATVTVGERSGRLGAIFAFLAEFHEERLQRRRERLNILLMPVLLILLGTIVGVFIYAVWSALIGINEGVLPQ